MTTPSFHLRRLPRFFGGGARIVGFSLAMVALSLSLAEAVAGDSSPQKKSHETPYALIIGTVWGPSDTPVYGVKVKIRRENEKKARWQAYSDHNGEFAQRVPAGKADYVAWVDPKSYKSNGVNALKSGEGVTIHVEYDERVDTSLHLR